ncbi:MAG: hypothetical protein IKK08_03370 [Clostridia bacterium]|nr:hypothetical protein [Clostridia bacterium]
MRNKCLGIILTVLLCFMPFRFSLAEETQTVLPGVESVVMEQNGNRLAYPKLTGMSDARIQQAINDDIIVSAGLTSHMITFASLTPDSLWGLQVSYDSYCTESFISFVISAEGKMPNNRQGHTNTPLTYDLSTGKRLKPSALFADPAAAQEWLETEALNTLGKEISDYEDSSALLPLPMERFSLDEYGITFWYEPEQFTKINGEAGACHFEYAEIQHLLLKDGLPSMAGMLVPTYSAEEQRENVWKALAQGKLEQIPVTLGDPMQQLVDTFGLSRTPDEFPGGRYFVMDHPAFRSILLISDAMQNSYEDSVLQGIQLRRGSFCGFLVGETTRYDWQKVLGEPAQVIQLTEDMAYEYDLPEGYCDIYTHCGNTVRLYADDKGVLAAVQFETN